MGRAGLQKQPAGPPTHPLNAWRAPAPGPAAVWGAASRRRPGPRLPVARATHAQDWLVRVLRRPCVSAPSPSPVCVLVVGKHVGVAVAVCAEHTLQVSQRVPWAAPRLDPSQDRALQRPLPTSPTSTVPPTTPSPTPNTNSCLTHCAPPRSRTSRTRLRLRTQSLRRGRWPRPRTR